MPIGVRFIFKIYYIRVNKYYYNKINYIIYYKRYVKA